MSGDKEFSAGTNLVEYVIPIATVGIIFGIALFNFYQNGTLSKFIEASTAGKVQGKTLNISPSNSSTPENSPLNNTNNNTNTNSPGCDNNGVCTVVIGDYTLTGIPEDMAQAIEANGTGGVENQIGVLLEQLSDQVAAEYGNNDLLAAEIRKLASTVGDIYSDDNNLSKANDGFSNLIYDYELAVKGNITPDGTRILKGEDAPSPFPVGTIVDIVTNQIVYDPTKPVDQVKDTIKTALDTSLNEADNANSYYLDSVYDEIQNKLDKATGTEYDKLVQLKDAITAINQSAEDLGTNFLTTVANNTYDINDINSNVASKSENVYGLLMCVSDKVYCAQ